jgi:hypothetical protein
MQLNNITSDTQNSTRYTGTQLRILELLGTGLSPEIVASAAGVTPSYISQLLSEESFSKQVTQLRFDNLQAANARDRAYDDIEDKLIEKMRDLLPMMYKPLEVLRAIREINGAKRRGSAAPESIININNTVVNLTIPNQILQRFIVNAANQVVEVSAQEDNPSNPNSSAQTLVTMPSSQLLGKFKPSIKEIPHDPAADSYAAG